jgi:hypothetical protein
VKIPALSAIVSGYAQPRAISVTLAINKGRANALEPAHARINARFAMEFAHISPHAPAVGLTRRVPLTKFVSRVLPNFDSRAPLQTRRNQLLIFPESEARRFRKNWVRLCVARVCE